MRVTYDAAVDAAYVYLVGEINAGDAVRTVPVDPREIGGMINLDFDAEGRLVGVEVLDASRFLSPETYAGGSDDRGHHRDRHAEVRSITPAEAAVAVAVAERISRELDEDYVGLWVIPWQIRRRLTAATDAQVQELARVVLVGLSESAVRIGSLDADTGVFAPWPVSEGLDRVFAEWRDLGRDPNIGEIAWLDRED